MKAVVFAFVLGFILSVSVLWATSKLSHKHGADIRVVWYLFSLSLVVTSGIALWAVSSGLIDAHGKFIGYSGAILEKLFHIMLDLNTDIYILISVVSVVVIPQLLNYFLSGLSGCAANPLFIKKSLEFLIWGYIKSLMVASGIVFAVALFGACKSLDGFAWKGVLSMFYLSAMLVMLSFLMLFWYREMSEDLPDFKNPKFASLIKWLGFIHRWLIRNNPSKID